MQEGFRPELGIRLQAVADLVRKGKCIADIGCDHGFVSIALIQSGAAEFVIACDVKEGPLKAAKEHVAAAGLKDRIDCRLADGLAGLKENEADGIIIAGMGGPLGLRILYDGRDKLKGVNQVVLQIQSKSALVRFVLKEWGFETISEEMVFEDGKYYVLMDLKTPAENSFYELNITDWEAYLNEKEAEFSGKNTQELANYTYGEKLIEKKSPVLLAFLEKEEERLLSVADELSAHPGEKSEEALGKINESVDVLMAAKWRICGIS